MANTSISASYAWQQGVEIASLASYDAGMVKIHAGAYGHMIPQLNFSGSIAPLSARSLVLTGSSSNIKLVFPHAGVRGLPMFGGTSKTSSPQITTFYRFDKNDSKTSPYREKYLNNNLTASMINDDYDFKRLNSVEFFVDQRLQHNVTSSRFASEFMTALSVLTGSTEYIRYQHRCANAGYTDDGDGSIGIDSIAFRGLTF